MAFLLNSQAQGVSGKNEQSSQTPWRGAPEARGPMQLHRLKAGVVDNTRTTRNTIYKNSRKRIYGKAAVLSTI